MYGVKVGASRKVEAIAVGSSREAERELVCCSHSVLFFGPFGRRDLMMRSLIAAFCVLAVWSSAGNADQSGTAYLLSLVMW